MRLAPRLQYNGEFAPVLRQTMANVRSFKSFTADLQKELDETKGMVMDNINAVMRRASQLESIENEAMELRDNAAAFERDTDDLKKKMLCKKLSMTIGIVVAIIAVVLAIVIPIYLKASGKK